MTLFKWPIRVGERFKKKKRVFFNFSKKGKKVNIIQKFYKYNRFGKFYFNTISRKLSKNKFIHNTKFNSKKRYKLYPNKHFLNKKLKNFKFFIKENRYHILEKDKIDLDYYYKKSFKNNKRLKEKEIKKLHKLKFIKTQFNKVKDFNKNFFFFKNLKNNVTNLTNFITKKDFKNLNLSKKFIQKQLLFSLKYYNYLNNNLKNKFQILNNLFNNNNNKNNFLTFFTINLNNNNNNNLKKISSNFLFLKIKEAFFEFFKKKKQNFNFEIFENPLVIFSIIQEFQTFLIRFFSNLTLRAIRGYNFLNLNNLFFLTKQFSQFSNLFFENKKSIIQIQDNLILKDKNLELKLLQKIYPDNIFDITKNRYIAFPNYLTKQGFKNLNNNIAFLKFKKKKTFNLFN